MLVVSLLDSIVHTITSAGDLAALPLPAATNTWAIEDAVFVICVAALSISAVTFVSEAG